jgi:HAD superfamily hydrolase (TIGR01509 family)
MRPTGYVFDFNGTLFWDNAIQESSWDFYLKKQGIALSRTEKDKYIHGRSVKDTFEFLFGRKPDPEELKNMTGEKEAIYRDECLKKPMNLAPGADELLSCLKEKGYPITIATASCKENVDFFIRELKLWKYFDVEKIVFDDWIIPGKPDPALFLNAMKNIGRSPEETVIFEDSVSGILAAERSNAKKIIIVNSTGSDYSKYPHLVIKSFTEFTIE